MQQYLEELLVASDRHVIPYRAWLTEHPGATLLISHGMSEHAGRYAPFAEYLAARNVNTWAVEHRGHGVRCPGDDRGHFADHDGWRKAVSDLNRLKRHALEQTPDLPLILLGHSMGSYLALAAVMAETEGYAGLLLTGSGLNPKRLLRAGMAATAFETLRLGARGRSTLMNAVTFQSFNRRFRPNRTAFDWLSRDNEQVDRYIADPLCGFACTNRFWLDLLHGQLDLYALKKRHTLPTELPVRLISGSEDPVGRFGSGVHKLEKLLRAGGVSNVSVELIPGARHEVLNEIDRDTTWAGIGDWIHEVANRARGR